MLFLSAEWGSTKTGEQDQLIVTALNCVLRVPRYIPQEQRFDVRVLVRRSRTLDKGSTCVDYSRVDLFLFLYLSHFVLFLYTRVWVS